MVHEKPQNAIKVRGAECPTFSPHRRGPVHVGCLEQRKLLCVRASPTAHVWSLDRHRARRLAPPATYRPRLATRASAPIKRTGRVPVTVNVRSSISSVSTKKRVEDGSSFVFCSSVASL